ncbi:MAG: DUF4430 domain-containing protein [Parcubacteria group bacterium]|jgi:hypothetical protein
MENITKTLKERASGLLLLVFAATIAAGISVSSHQAESKNAQNLSAENQTSNASNDTKVLGEADNNSEEVTNDSENATSNIVENNSPSQKTSEPEIKTEDKTNRCDNLKRLLKKYCGDNYNVKKCRENLIETRDLSKKDDQCKSLYKKYHFVPKKVEEKDSGSVPDSSSGGSEVKEEVTLTINYANGKADDKYTIAVGSGMTVMDMMRKVKESGGLSYGESSAWPGYIQEINGVREDLSKSIFWMLYYNGEMAAEGAATLKVKSGDKIEWKYMAVSW